MKREKKDVDIIMKTEDIKNEMIEFAEIVKKYEKFIFRICYRFIGNIEDSKDLAQETFLKAWNSRDQFDSTRNVKPWICKIAVNLCLSELRKSKNKVLELKDYMIQGNKKDNPEFIIENNELSEHIQEVLDELEPDYKIVIVLKYMLNQKYAEIEKILGITKSTLESRLFRARKMFKFILKQKKYGVIQ